MGEDLMKDNPDDHSAQFDAHPKYVHLINSVGSLSCVM